MLSRISSVYLFVGLLFTFNALAQEMVVEQKSDSFRILLISDLNDSYGSVSYSEEVKDVVAQVGRIRPDLILCAGDMVAGQKASLTVAELEAMWSGFAHTVLNPIDLLYVPFAFTMGNHDASPNYHNDRAVASAFWLENKAKTRLDFVDDSHYPYYFSYIKNNIFFISWDASSAIIPATVMDWMREQLQSPLAKAASGKLVLGHLPLYAIVNAKNKTGEVLEEADATLDFLKENAVDMYISGHQHAYFPASKKKVALLHTGCLGGGPRPLIGHDFPAYKSYTIIEVPKNAGLREASIEGFVARDNSMIRLESLPKSITGFNGTVERIDLAD